MITNNFTKKKNECIRCFHVDTYLHKWVVIGDSGKNRL